MNQLLILYSAFLLLFINTFSQQNNSPLFRIFENNRYGYIDLTGKIIIQPKFYSAGDFSEGLAPVRENGYYGFIDGNGIYVLSPIYDYAESFKNGYAKIYVDGIPNFINKEGTKIIPFECSQIFPFNNNFSIVYTEIINKSRKAGVINKYGRLVVDTIYSEIANFDNGLFIVSKPYEIPGIIDTNGNFIVPLEKFKNIYQCHNGFAKVTWYKDNNSKITNLSQGFINKNGELVLSLENSFNLEIDENVSEDSLFIAKELNIVDIRDNSFSYDSVKKGGIMNLKGEWVCIDSVNCRYEYIENKICSIDSNNLRYFIDRNGNFTGSKFFDYKNGKKIIYSFAGEKNPIKERKFGLIDTSLKFIIKPFFEIIHFGIKDDYFIFSQYLTDANENYIPVGDGANLSKLGICRLDGSLIHKPAFDQVDHDCYKNGLILVVENGKPAYLNTDGKVVWKKPETKNVKPYEINIDYQLSTNFSEYYGWQPIENKPTEELENINFSNNELSIVLTNEKTIFNNLYNGITLYLINDLENSVSAPSVDGALYMVLQAKDRFGNWRNIESYPSSSCGNSYVPTTIAGKYFRKYSIPKYTGFFKTKIRCVLQTYEKYKNNYKYYYSNEIEGSINPAQFWRDLSIFHIKSILER